jgi:predicted transglutaminase-like cysteine proteinase
MTRTLLALAALALSACQSEPAKPPSRALQDGGFAHAPQGWSEYCAREGREQGDPSC